MKLRNKVHLGCGKRNFGDEWLHIDYDYSGGDHINEAMDLNCPGISFSLLKHNPGGFRLIYASHLLSYIEDDLLFLQECYSLLNEGGTLRLAVPDFDAIVKIYQETGTLLQGPLFGKMEVTNYDEVLHYKEAIYHKRAYTLKNLSALLKEAGFRHVYFWHHDMVEHGHIDDHSNAWWPSLQNPQYHVSLNLEGVK